MRTHLVCLCLGAVLALGLPERSLAATYEVRIERMAFGALPSELQPGDVIQWHNADIVPHTATAKDGQFDVQLAPGEQGTSVLSDSGRIEVFCIYHPTMRAVLLVGRSDAGGH